jgi:chitin synthase
MSFPIDPVQKLMIRRVEGELRSKGHDDKTAVFDGTTIPLRRWEDWEKSRLRKHKREERRRRDFERQFGNGGFHDSNSSDGGHGQYGLTPGYPQSRIRSEYESDAGSVFSGDEDIWGAEIGGVSLRSQVVSTPS